MALTTALLAATVAIAAEVDEGEIVVAAARQESDGRYRFSVTLRHADTGLDHSADKWDVVAPRGRVLGARGALHPHEDEQPFTRSLLGVRSAQGVKSGQHTRP